MQEIHKLMTIKQLSQTLGLSESSLRWHLRQGRLRCYRLGRKILFNTDEVMKDLKKFQR